MLERFIYDVVAFAAATIFFTLVICGCVLLLDLFLSMRGGEE